MDTDRMDEELAKAISVLEGILGEDQDGMWDAETKTEQDEMWDDLPSEVLEEIIKEEESEMQNVK